MYLSAINIGLTLSELDDMDIGEIIDFVIVANNRYEEAENKYAHKGSGSRRYLKEEVRKATSKDNIMNFF